MIRKTIKGGDFKSQMVGELVFDQVPEEGSFNPVTSDAVVKAIDKAKDDMQEKIDEVTLDPSAVALGNVHLLDEVTEFPADGSILVDSETNGPGEMSKDTLLQLTSQNAIDEAALVFQGKYILDISAMFPDGSGNNDDVYTLAEAIQKVPGQADYVGWIRFKAKRSVGMVAYETYYHARQYAGVRNWNKCVAAPWTYDQIGAEISGLSKYVFDVRVESSISLEYLKLYNIRKEDDTYKVSLNYQIVAGSSSSPTIVLPAHDSDVGTEKIVVTDQISLVITYTTMDFGTAVDAATKVPVNTIVPTFQPYFKRVGRSFNSSGFSRIYAKKGFTCNSLVVMRIRNIADSYVVLTVLVDGVSASCAPFGAVNGQHSGITKFDFGDFHIYVDLSKYQSDFQAYSPNFYLEYRVDMFERYEEKSPETLDNDLVSQKFGSGDGVTIVNEGGTSSLDNYGLDNVRYRIPIKPCSKLHLYVEFKYNDTLQYVNDNTYGSLVKFNGSASFNIRPFAIANTDKLGIQPSLLFVAKREVTGDMSGGTVQGAYKNRPWNGDNAFSVRYMGESTKVTIAFKSGEVLLKDDGVTLQSISFNLTDSVASLVSSLSALSYLDVVPYAVDDKLCSDLLLADADIPMTNSFAVPNSSDIVDNPPIYEVYKVDNKWHSLELMVDFDGKYSYAAYDGILAQKPNYGIPNEWVLELGGTYNGSNLPVTFKNLHIGYDSYEDAEIVTHVPQSSYASSDQMISNHNPKLIIWELHEVYAGDDSTATEDPYYPYCESTSRIYRMFEALKRKGYLPVTMSQVIDWKKNGTPLPKRCYACIMDDFRVGNYLDPNKRKPFARYGVESSLAVIVGESFDPADEITIDGHTISAGDALRSVKSGKWEMFSHFDHQSVNSFAPSLIQAAFNKDAFYCETNYVDPSAIVYPRGAVNATSMKVLHAGPYKVGVTIIDKEYNCRGRSDFWLTRNSFEAGFSIESALSVIV